MGRSSAIMFLAKEQDAPKYIQAEQRIGPRGAELQEGVQSTE